MAHSTANYMAVDRFSSFNRIEPIRNENRNDDVNGKMATATSGDHDVHDDDENTTTTPVRNDDA